MDRQNPTYIQIESLLSNLLRERTGYELLDLDRDATFMELGFDSLFLIQLSQVIKQRSGVKVAFRQLMEDVNSIDKLIDHLVANQPAGLAASDLNASVSNGVNTAPAPVAEPQPASPVAATKIPAAPASLRQTPPAMPLAAAVTVTAAPVPSIPSTASIPATKSLIVPPLALNANSEITQPAATFPTAQVTGANGVEQIILQQNALMAQHLAILQGQPVAPAIPAAEPVQAVAAQPITELPCIDPCVHKSREALGVTEVAVDQAVVPTKAANKHERLGPYKPIRRGDNSGLTDKQQAHLSEFVERFTRKTAKSRSHAETHRDHFADPRGVASYRRIWKTMVYQIAVEKSKGTMVRDIDGNEYVDIAMGFGLNLFGQSPDFITKALHEQLDRGVEVGPQSPIAGEVAQLLCDFARKERVTFCNTGSEAVMAAMRLARTVTGKSKVVYFNKDYHGNFDQVLVRSTRIGNKQVSTPAAPGVPQSNAEMMIVLEYGSPESLQMIRERADEIAAVLIEPVQSADPFLQPKEFLHEIRRITKENNMAMIMDEVITGFRAAQGGAQEWFDVWADMSTYGKILGGGLPIGALAGSSEYMDALDGGTWRYDDDSEPEADMTFFAGTFVRHPLGLVAAQQVLRKLKEEGPELQVRLTARTTNMVQTLNTFFEREKFPIRVAQFASQFRFMFPLDLEYADLLYFHLLDRGIFTRGWADNCFLSTEHSDEDIAKVIDAVQESCLDIRRGGFFPDAPDDESADSENGVAPAATNGLSNGAAVKKKNQSATEPVGLISAIPSTSSAAFEPLSTLVEIQPEGSRIPIFCTPAADGFTRVYHELSDCLGEDQPVYGLDSPGIYGLPLPDTLEEMAAGLVAEIREVQAEGPYILIGYCSGGTVALEIAQQLIAAGEKVAMLGLIETYNWATAPSTNPTLLTKMSYERQRVGFHLRNFFLLNMSGKKEFMSSKLHALKVRLKVWRGAIASFFSFKKRRPVTVSSVNMAELWRKHDDLAEGYAPQPYPGRLIHFRPKRDYKCHLGTELEATGSVEYHRLRAYPAGVMVNPFVNDLAEMLNAAIREGLMDIENSNKRSSSTSNATREAINA